MRRDCARMREKVVTSSKEYLVLRPTRALTARICQQHYTATRRCSTQLTSKLRFLLQSWLSTGEGKWAVALKCLIRLGCLVQRLTVYSVATVNSHLPIALDNHLCRFCLHICLCVYTDDDDYHHVTLRSR